MATPQPTLPPQPLPPGPVPPADPPGSPPGDPLPQPIDDAIRRVVRMNVLPRRAFTAITTRIPEWWPRDWTWSGKALEEIVIEPFVGGHCFEHARHGMRFDFGRVLAFDAPDRLSIAWHVSPLLRPDPAHASRVDVRFHADGYAGVRIELVHRQLARHGGGWAGYRARLDGPKGWTHALNRLVELLVMEEDGVRQRLTVTP